MVFIISSFSGCSILGDVLNSDSDKKNVRNEEADRALYEAIQRDDIEAIDQALQDGANINQLSASAVDGRYDNPVAIALFEGQNRQTAKHLLEKGADPNAKIQYGVSVLTYAAMNDLYDLAKYMLENGADPNCKDYVNEWTAIDYAAQSIYESKNFIEMMNLLIQYGGKPSKQTVDNLIDKYPHQDIAENNNHYKSLHYLVTYMSDHNIKTGLDTGFEAAIIGDSKKLLKYLKDGKLTDEYQKTILEYAAAYCNPEVLEYLINNEWWCSLSYRTSNASSLLMLAAYGDNVDNMIYLKEKGVNINSQDNDILLVDNHDSGQTALYIATKEQSYEAVKWLLANEATISYGMDIEDEKHEEALEMSILSINCDIEMLKLYINHGYYLSEEALEELIDNANSMRHRGHTYDSYDEFIRYVKNLSKN